MQSFSRPSTRAALITGVAGAAVLGAVAVGGAAFAESAPTPSASASAPSPSGAPAAPRAHAPHIGGEVLTVSGSTVTVQDHDGFTRTIALASGVKVTKDDAAATTAAVVKGRHIEATGTVDADGTTLDATAVRVGEPARPDGRGGPGRGPRAARGDGERPTLPEGGPAAPGGTPSAAPSTPAQGS